MILTLVILAPFAVLVCGLLILAGLAPFTNDEWVRR